MSNVTIHYSKEEWECNDEGDSRVSFFISRNSVLKHDLLECSCEFVQFEVSRRIQLICRNLFYLQIVLSC